MKKLLIFILLLVPLVCESATITSAASGNWSDTSKWDLSRIPAAGDDVVIANGHTMVWDVTLVRIPSTSGTLKSISSAGGTGAITIDLSAAEFHGGAALYANTMTAGTASLLTTTGSTDHVLTVTVGTEAGQGVVGGSAVTCRGISHVSTGTLNLVGNITGGTTAANAAGIYNAGAGVVVVTGNISGSATSYGFWNQSTGAVTVNGSITGGGGASAFGFVNNGTGAVAVNGGNISGGTGLQANGFSSQSTGQVTLSANTNLIQGTKGAAYEGSAPAWASATAAANGYASFYTGTGFLQAANTQFPQVLAAGNIKSGVTSGSVTGTLSAGGSAAY